MGKISWGSYAYIQYSIEKIPSEDVQTALQEAFDEVAHLTYEPIFMTATIATVVIIVLSIIFRGPFKQDAIEENESLEK